MKSLSVRAAATTLAACLGLVPFCRGDSCTGPAALELRIHAHPDATNYEELGRWYGDRHQYACAAEALRKGLGLEPNSAELSYLLGVTLYMSGDARAAIEPLRQSLQLQATAKEAHLLLAAAFMELQDKSNAKPEYEAALRLDPRSTKALDGLSRLLLADGNYVGVINLLRSAPHDEALTLDLAQAYGKARMLDEAAWILESAVRTNPSSLRLTMALTTVYVTQTRYQEAKLVAQKSVRLHPDSVEAQNQYLHALVLNRDLDLARTVAKRLLAAHPHDFEALCLSGTLEREDHQYSAAQQHLEEAIKIDPSSFDARYNLGMVLVDLNQPAKAKEQLDKALALGAGTSEPQVRYRLSMVLRTLGESQQAEEQSNLAQKGLQAVQDNTMAFAKSEEAESALKSGNAQKAVMLYREALESAPNDASINFKLAVALDRAGDFENEQAALEKALKIDPTFALAHCQMGHLASQNEDFATAEEHYRQAVLAAPAYPEAWVGLAATLGNESRFSEALDAVAKAIRLDRRNGQALQLRRQLLLAQAGH